MVEEDWRVLLAGMDNEMHISGRDCSEEGRRLRSKGASGEIVADLSDPVSRKGASEDERRNSRTGTAGTEVWIWEERKPLGIGNRCLGNEAVPLGIGFV